MKNNFDSVIYYMVKKSKKRTKFDSRYFLDDGDSVKIAILINAEKKEWTTIEIPKMDVIDIVPLKLDEKKRRLPK